MSEQHYAAERSMIGFALSTLLILIALEVVAAVSFLSTIPQLFEKYAIWVFYLDISIVALITTLWHFLMYKVKFTCMTGMMLGMTFGMQTAMLIGAVIGATNGFFTGAVVGVLLGVGAGILTGKCCGIMGIMEGMMAGLMGGTMGPMITLMMFNDHVQWFMPLYTIVNLLILGGLSLMLVQEVDASATKDPPDFSLFVSPAVIVTVLLIAVMIYGPHGGFL